MKKTKVSVTGPAAVALAAAELYGQELSRLRAENEQLRKALELAVEDVAARFISSNITIADYIDMAKQALGEKP